MDALEEDQSFGAGFQQNFAGGIFHHDADGDDEEEHEANNKEGTNSCQNRIRGPSNDAVCERVIGLNQIIYAKRSTNDEACCEETKHAEIHTC